MNVCFKSENPVYGSNVAIYTYQPSYKIIHLEYDKLPTDTFSPLTAPTSTIATKNQ